MSTAIDGAGTTEALWQQWLPARCWPSLDLDAAAGRRVVVLAAHPDDEVLGVGGLMVRLSRLGCPLVVVWATDGEGSHPESTVFSRDHLAQIRRAESRRALARLDVRPADTHHLGLPDSGLADCRAALATDLRQIIAADDLVIAPWENDGHPDHDTVGQVALEVSPHAWRYPIWMWHWGHPDHADVPWQRLHTIEVPDQFTKAAAISEFTSQVAPLGNAPADAAVLPPHVLARFNRPEEWVFA
jgi:LmbE family N-acetylglucosaminyl deacetylase